MPPEKGAGGEARCPRGGKARQTALLALLWVVLAEREQIRLPAPAAGLAPCPHFIIFLCWGDLFPVLRGMPAQTALFRCPRCFKGKGKVTAPLGLPGIGAHLLWRREGDAQQLLD